MENLNLIEACKDSDLNKARDIVNSKRIHDIDEIGFNEALLTASLNNDSEMIKILIEAESKINQTNPSSHDIAIVGMACRFPNGSNTIDEYWSNLKNGYNGITLIPQDRWNSKDFYDENRKAPGKMYTKHGGFIDQPIRDFDANFFRISPREAEMLDPQQRLLLEVSWEAFESGGIVIDRFEENKTGVFIGAMTHDYSDMMAQYNIEHNSFVGSGNGFSVMSGRLSYFYGLQGPSMTIDTACSSSLVTTHYAFQSLNNRECDMAITGGVNVMVSPNVTINCCKAEMLSQTGQCQTFDANADGYVRSEGCGILVLKRLSDAIKDSNIIFGVIKGSGINQDGATSGLTVPNRKSQVNVINQALKVASLYPEDIDYIEAHGTGTSLGDPIEINALRDVFDKIRSKNVYVGSVKTNVGHLEAAAGAASLIKTVLSLKNEFIPKHVNLVTLNPKINLERSKIKIALDGVEWSKAIKKRRAGVSSFGFSGTNAHVIIEEAPDTKRDTQTVLKNQWNKVTKRYESLLGGIECAELKEYNKNSHLLVLSAKNEKALIDLQKKYIEFLKESKEGQIEQDMCFTASVGRTHFSEHRIAFVFNDSRDLQDKLKKSIDNTSSNDSIKKKQQKNSKNGKIAFLFTGQGSQYAQMGHELYESNLIFRSLMNHCDSLLSRHLESPRLIEIVYGERSNEYLNDTQYAQVALFSFEYSLACLWMTFGLSPDVVMGHSIGEYVACVLSGRMSLEDGIKLAYLRGRLMKQTQTGKMIAVLYDLNKLERLIQQLGNKVDIAGINSNKQIVVSGSIKDIDDLGKVLVQNGCTSVRELNTNKAFHSRYMDPILEEFEREATTIKFYNQRTNNIVWISTYDGAKTRDPNFTLNSKHWSNHLRHKVDFLGSMKIVNDLDVTSYIEIGPSVVLTKLAQQCLSESSMSLDNILWLNSLKVKTSDMFELQRNLASWYVNGGYVDWSSFYSSYSTNLVMLPSYPFQRQPYWIDVTHNPVIPKPAIENKHFDDSSLYYSFDWIEYTRSQARSFSTKLVFLSSFLSNNLVFKSQLKQFYSSQKLIYVHSGSKYDQIDDENILIDYSSSFTELFKSIPSKFDIIIFYHQEDPSKDLQYSPSFYLLLNLTKTLNELKLKPNIYVLTSNSIVTNQDHDLNFNQAALTGFCKSLALEYLGFLCHIDIDIMSHDVLNLLETDIKENLIVYRNSNYLVPRLRQTELKRSGQVEFDTDGAYVITGGLGAIGLKLTEWLIEKGVKYIYLMSRRDPNKEIEKIMRLKRPGTTLAAVPCDVSKLDDLEKILLDIHSQFGLKGIIHAAGNLDIKLLKNLDLESLSRVLDPKVKGTWNLHHVTTKHEIKLKHFILFSSSASVIPSLGQSHYSAANSFLDQMANYRAAKGLPVLSINWGLWSDVGMGSDKDFNKRLERGVQPVSAEDNLASLDRVLNSNPPAQLAIMNIDWTVYKKSVNTFLSDLIPKDSKRDESRFESNDVLDLVKRVVSEVSRIDEKELVIDKRFAELGIDSLMSTEIGNLIQDKLGDLIQIPATLTIEYDSIQDIAQFLKSELSLDEKQDLDPVKYMRDQMQSSNLKPVLLSKSSGPNVFLIHTIMGSVYFYNALTDYLSNFTVYGINDPNFSHPENHFKSIEDMAECYTKIILNTDPIGPYRIIGLSFAGAVAYEIGRQLVNDNKPLEAVIMLDTVKPSLNHLELPSREQASFVMGQVSKDMDDYYQAEIENNQKILNNYEPKPYDGRIILFKARGLDSVSLSLKNLDDPFNDWLNTITPEIYSIPGSHFSLFDKGYALLTAEKIKYVLSMENTPDVLRDQRLSVLDRLFLHAVRESDFYFVSWLIENGADIHSKDGLGRNALHWAAVNDDIGLVHFLLSTGNFDLNQEDNEQKTPLILSYEHKNLQVFSFLGQLSFGKAKIRQFNIRDVLNMSKKSISSSFNVEWKRREWLDILENFNSSGQEDKPMGGQALLIKKMKEKTETLPSTIDIGSNMSLDVLWKISEGDYPPVFLIHAASGLSLPYLKISIPNKSVYGISNPYFNRSGNFDSIDTMASYYIQLIKSVQPKGPYFIGGWSLGGIIAINMAARLPDVGLVIMIDSVNHYTKPANELDTKIAIDRLVEKMPKSEYTESIRDQYFHTAKLLHNYRSPVYEGNVLLLKARQPETIYDENSQELRSWKTKISNDPYCGWKGVFKNIEVRSVPGEHHALFEYQPSVQAINTELKSVFSKSGLVDNFLGAVIRNDEHLIELFLNEKNDLGSKDDENRSVLHWAVLNKNEKLVKQLEFNGSKDKYGRTPLEYALEMGFLSIYKLLKLKV